MLKKYLLIGSLIIVYVLFFQGCGQTVKSISQESFDKVEVLDMYSQAAEKIENFSTVKVKMNTDFFVNNGINSFQLNMLTNIQQIKDEKGLAMEIESSTKYSDKEIENISYYKDGFFFTEYDSKKVKYRINEEEIKNENNVFLTQIDINQVKNYYVEKNEDGSKNITLIVDPEAIESRIEKYILNIMDTKEENISVTNYRITILVDSNNLIKSCDTLIILKNCNENDKMEYTIDSYMEYYEINESVNINFPDLSNYYEVSID